ncbi:UDP-N-acetylmuramate--L-alanine ligase [Deinococcus cellulosilyticus]|uniref:UDP-N-acetylmuramate--L-alanine ligase n=1 Tax=Deinococcus cellulosilyticus (strain DSM 18568 / NBRC 106333 / KACC 11606 / 5516J-15) TaxID=1223518 RepID=A0A511MX08_DEIC1|nr:UDP-N-acetylmuramate--L-alanine ligase [Deinococcus cellulosilyticus]GEM45114.1 UDP-N-acetylmuramate--L-alanine ligase [Deinococcus cellulosilyticus NBRC 106333 = KACC 11606]
MNYHLMAVCGIGVSGLARLLKAQGHQVSGCDAKVNEMGQQLISEGIEVWEKHNPDHISEDLTALILSTAIKDSEPEVVKARELGIPVLRRIQVLDEIMQGAPASIGIAGTHGKTTTTSLTAVAMMGAGLDPSAFVGSVLPDFEGSNVRLGSGPFVAEIDESDPQFQHLKVSIAVMTNLEDDHVSPDGQASENYYASVESLHAAFREYVQNAQKLIYCADWEGLDAFTANHPDRVSYGIGRGDYQAFNIESTDQSQSFDLLVRGEYRGRVFLTLLGNHNVLNSLAALSVVGELGGDMAGAITALAQFRGAGRRWQEIGRRSGALIVDDYAHNPTKVQAALQAARQTGRRVRVIFQPHRYKRTQLSWERYATILTAADEVILLDIYGASETPIEGVHSGLIQSRMTELGFAAVFYAQNFDEAIRLALSSLQENDLLLTLGAGDVTRIAVRLLE